MMTMMMNWMIHSMMMVSFSNVLLKKYSKLIFFPQMTMTMKMTLLQQETKLPVNPHPAQLTMMMVKAH